MSDTPLKVLLIEDDPEDTLLVQDALAELPGAPFTLETGDRLSAGLQRLAAKGVDVLLLDLSLPEGRGLDTLRLVRDQAPDVPVVVLTGLDDQTLALRAVQEGAQDYLVKGAVNPGAL